MDGNTPEIKRGRKYDQVIAGARDVFLAQGFEGASVDLIAREAGVSKATLYSYFPDKRILFIEVAKKNVRRKLNARCKWMRPTFRFARCLPDVSQDDGVPDVELRATDLQDLRRRVGPLP